MPYYYYNESNNEVGPFRGREIRQFAADGTITPETKIKFPDGSVGRARKVPELQEIFRQTTESIPKPSEHAVQPSSATTSELSSLILPMSESPMNRQPENGIGTMAENLEEQDFERIRADMERLGKQQERQKVMQTTAAPAIASAVLKPSAPPPVAANPFSAPIQTAANQTERQVVPTVTVPAAKGNKSAIWISLVGIVILLGVGGIVWAVLEGDRKSRIIEALNQVAVQGYKRDVLSDHPLAIVNMDFNWTTPSADDTEGTYDAVMKTTEALYVAVDNGSGLQKLDITDFYDKEFKNAQDTLRTLPKTIQQELQKDMPRDLSRIQFYNVLVPKEGEVTQTGSVEMNKRGKDWQVVQFLVYPFSCGDEFIPESKLHEEAYKLGNPKTKEAILAIIQNRKDFVAKVDSAITELKKKQEEWDKAFVQVCGSGTRYTGHYQFGVLSGNVDVVFINYTAPRTPMGQEERNDSNSMEGMIGGRIGSSRSTGGMDSSLSRRTSPASTAPPTQKKAVSGLIQFALPIGVALKFPFTVEQTEVEFQYLAIGEINGLEPPVDDNVIINFCQFMRAHRHIAIRYTDKTGKTECFLRSSVSDPDAILLELSKVQE